MYTAVDLGAGVGRIELVDVEASMGASAGVVHIVGPVLLGCLLGWCLYGMLFGQLFIYYMSFPQDRLLVKFSVYILFALETLQTTAITQLAWALLCAGWGDPRALRFSAWGYAALPLVSALVAAWVQLFFAWRVGVLAFGSGSGGEGAGTGTGTGEGSGGGAGWRWIWRVVVALVVLSALVQCVAGIVASIKFMALSDVAKSYADIMRPNAAVRTWLASSAACDVLVAASMVILLSSARHHNRDHQRRDPPQRPLARVLRVTVETGALTAAAAVLEVALRLSASSSPSPTPIASPSSPTSPSSSSTPNPGPYAPNTHTSTSNGTLLLLLLLSKLYTNTLLAALNARLRGDAATLSSFSSASSAMSTWRWGVRGGGGGGGVLTSVLFASQGQAGAGQRVETGIGTEGTGTWTYGWEGEEGEGEDVKGEFELGDVGVVGRGGA